MHQSRISKASVCRAVMTCLSLCLRSESLTSSLGWAWGRSGDRERFFRDGSRSSLPVRLSFLSEASKGRLQQPKLCPELELYCTQPEMHNIVNLLPGHCSQTMVMLDQQPCQSGAVMLEAGNGTSGTSGLSQQCSGVSQQCSGDAGMRRW